MKKKYLLLLLAMFFPVRSQAQLLNSALVAKRSLGGVAFIKTGRSRGSGFLISEGGEVLTNWHVVRSSRRRHVEFKEDSRRYSARVLFHDARRDIAVLRLDGFVYNPAVHRAIPLLDGVPEVGEPVVAYGNPQGETFVLTRGVISKLRVSQRSWFLQIDAPVSSGNSGGPLISRLGWVAGMDSAILTADKGGVAQNMNWAVRPDTLVGALDDLGIIYSVEPLISEVELLGEEGYRGGIPCDG